MNIVETLDALLARYADCRCGNFNIGDAEREAIIAVLALLRSECTCGSVFIETCNRCEAIDKALRVP